MDSNLAYRREDDSSSLMIEESFEKYESKSQRILKRDHSKTEKTDFVDNLASSMPRTSETPNSIPRAIETPCKEGHGETLSSPSNPSHPSSNYSFYSTLHVPSTFRNMLHRVLTKAVASTLASTCNTSPPSTEEPSKQVQLPSLGVGQEGESSHGRNLTSGLADDNGSLQLQKLVQERQTDCLLLQQKLDSKDSEIAQLQTIVESLRETKKQHASDVERLRVALKQASQKATKARNEANKADTNGAALMMRLQSFETVVKETKRASALLSQEQEEIRVGVEIMENERMQLHAAVTNHSEIKKHIQQENRRLTHQLRSSKTCLEEVQDKLESEQSEKLSLKRKYKELEVSAEMQETQYKRLQEDLDSKQILLLDSTAAVAESNLALKDCKQAMNRMEEANQHLHEQLLKNQATSQKREADHLDALDRAKKDHQETKLQLSNREEELRSLKVEKSAGDKRQESQAAKIFSLERRLKESTNLMSTTVSVPSTSQHSNGKNPENSSDKKGDHTLNIVVPPLVNRTSVVSKAKQCSICKKKASGLMKKCECGRSGCMFRAHATCVQQMFGGDSTVSLDSTTQHLSPPTVILCRSPGPTSTQAA